MLLLLLLLLFYLNNGVFLSRNYRLIVAPRKCDVLKTNQSCPRSQATGANMLVLRKTNFRGATIEHAIVTRHNDSIDSPLSFLPHANTKITRFEGCNLTRRRPVFLIFHTFVCKLEWV